ncbi:MAG: tRNA uracil 4-sulfurtransferase ThiI [Limnochordales bacterium]|nr:tRNA 4-thiouridine(8) synthase ThiI [Bacillota bacterium]
MEQTLLIRYGEIGLKGRNRHLFEDILVGNMRAALAPDVPAKVYREYGRMFVDVDPERTAEALRRLQRVFGIVAVNPALRTPLALEAIQEAAAQLVRRPGDPARTFRVSARRANKRFPYTSQELNHLVGAYVLRHVPNLSVRMTDPDVTVTVEIRDRAAYVYAEEVAGPGGLPVGASSRALLLLSGGIDSPVAGWMAMKRGIKVHALHFHSPPFTSERAKEKVVDLCRVLAAWSPEPLPLHVVHFTEVQKEIYRKVPEELTMTVMRRFMVRVAARHAAAVGAVALVTGESVGQVASQTLESMAAINAVTTMPILRPLVAFDKQETIALAQRIGTYEISIRPYEDCCTIFVPEHPATKPALADVEAAEQALDVEGLVAQAVASIETMAVEPQPAYAV